MGLPMEPRLTLNHQPSCLSLPSSGFPHSPLTEHFSSEPRKYLSLVIAAVQSRPCSPGGEFKNQHWPDGGGIHLYSQGLESRGSWISKFKASLAERDPGKLGLLLHKETLGGWRDGSVVQNTGCSPSTHMVAHNHL